jgi:hypothetical protein
MGLVIAAAGVFCEKSPSSNTFACHITAPHFKLIPFPISLRQLVHTRFSKRSKRPKNPSYSRFENKNTNTFGKRLFSGARRRRTRFNSVGWVSKDFFFSLPKVSFCWITFEWIPFCYLVYLSECLLRNQVTPTFPFPFHITWKRSQVYILFFFPISHRGVFMFGQVSGVWGRWSHGYFVHMPDLFFSSEKWRGRLSKTLIPHTLYIMNRKCVGLKRCMVRN